MDVKDFDVFTTERKITEKGLKNSSAKELPIDTVLFSSRATIGEVGVARIPLATNQGFKNFICDKSKLIPEYLAYFLMVFKKDIEKLASGATYKEISKTNISKYKIPLPSLEEQKEIASFFDDKRKLIIALNKNIAETEKMMQRTISTLFEK